jgi:hypothetical protein
MGNVNWRKSSYSGGQGGDCVEVASWRTSGYTGNGGGNCVEVADGSRGIRVRDTKDRDGRALAFTGDAWEAFTESLKQ